MDEKYINEDVQLAKMKDLVRLLLEATGGPGELRDWLDKVIADTILEDKGNVEQFDKTIGFLAHQYYMRQHGPIVAAMMDDAAIAKTFRESLDNLAAQYTFRVVQKENPSTNLLS